MDVFEFTTHSFIVKIWVEEIAEQQTDIIWRGHITHVPDGKRRYISNLNEIKEFIALYLEEMGIKTELSHGVKGWLRLRKLKLTR